MRSALLVPLLGVGVLLGCTADATGDAAKPAVANSFAGTPSATATPINNTAPMATAPSVDTAKPADAAEPTAPRDSAPGAPADPEAAAAGVRYRQVTIPAGTTLTVALTSSVSSKTSSVEDPVNGTLRHSIMINGVTAVPAGSAISGHVTEARRSGRVKGLARVGLRFTTLRAHDTRYDIRTASVSRQARATKKKDAVKIVAGAGTGALIGAIAGGKKGAAIGTAVGAGGGTGVVLATRGEEVGLGAGSVVTTRLTAPLTVRVRVQ